LVPFGQGISGEKICSTLANHWLLLKKSPLKLLGQMEPNLAGSIYVRSSIKFLRFVPFGQQIWLPRAILVSQSETRIALGSHICWPNEIKRRNFIEDLT
jgi:hypothetical protein